MPGPLGIKLCTRKPSPTICGAGGANICSTVFIFSVALFAVVAGVWEHAVDAKAMAKTIGRIFIVERLGGGGCGFVDVKIRPHLF